MDIDNIPPTVDFRDHLEQSIKQCDLLLALVGSNWMSDSRLDNPRDWVRVEIESALAQGKRIMPIMVNDATLPNPHDLPETLQDFAYKNGFPLDTGRDFQVHLDRIVHWIDEFCKEEASHVDPCDMETNEEPAKSESAAPSAIEQLESAPKEIPKEPQNIQEATQPSSESAIIAPLLPPPIPQPSQPSPAKNTANHQAVVEAPKDRIPDVVLWLSISGMILTLWTTIPAIIIGHMALRNPIHQSRNESARLKLKIGLWVAYIITALFALMMLIALLGALVG